MLIYADGTIVGTVGGGEMEAKVVSEAQETLRRGRSQMVDYELVNPNEGDPGICGGELTLYLEPYMPPHTIYVIGCGHVGRTVVDLAHWLGYHTIAIDDRPDLVSDEAMPNADVRFGGLGCLAKPGPLPFPHGTGVLEVAESVVEGGLRC